MNLLEAKIEMKNTPRGLPLSWYFYEAVAIVAVAVILVSFT